MVREQVEYLEEYDIV